MVDLYAKFPFCQVFEGSCDDNITPAAPLSRNLLAAVSTYVGYVLTTSVSLLVILSVLATTCAHPQGIPRNSPTVDSLKGQNARLIPAAWATRSPLVSCRRRGAIDGHATIDPIIDSKFDDDPIARLQSIKDMIEPTLPQIGRAHV